MYQFPERGVRATVRRGGGGDGGVQQPDDHQPVAEGGGSAAGAGPHPAPAPAPGRVGKNPGFLKKKPAQWVFCCCFLLDFFI